MSGMLDSIKKRLHIDPSDTNFDDVILEKIEDAKDYVKYRCIGRGFKEDEITEEFFEGEMVRQSVLDFSTSYFIVDVYPGQEDQSNDFFKRAQNTLDVYFKAVSVTKKLKKIVRIESTTYAPTLEGE